MAEGPKDKAVGSSVPMRARTSSHDNRDQAESNLRFLGLIIFENKLKPGTAPAIQALQSAHFACRMITGDNPLTAVSVAQECNLISQTAHVFTPAFIQGRRRQVYHAPC
jgi:magnesium-transporting ATPase (P-type)